MIEIDGRYGRREDIPLDLFSFFAFFLLLSFIFSFLFPSIFLKIFCVHASRLQKEFTWNEDIIESFIFEEVYKNVKQNVKGYFYVRGM